MIQSAAGRRQVALDLAHDILQHPKAWLDTPNRNLGDRRPIDLLNSSESDKVYYLLNAVDQGLFS